MFREAFGLNLHKFIHSLKVTLKTAIGFPEPIKLYDALIPKFSYKRNESLVFLYILTNVL